MSINIKNNNSMKKNVFNFWILIALVCGLSLSITSCKDDDKDELSPEEQEQQAIEQQEKEMTAYSVLDYLANMSNAPSDFLSGSYEPTIGQADGADASTRIVNTNDMETAAMRFSDLVDGGIDENAPSYTWSDERMGTLIYTKSNDGKSWATVDVNIKQIPHLSKIIYRSPEQADNNGKFDGTAYYRFGDVVRKENADGKNEFWICVRPAFGPEGKETSHWVTISALPTQNIWTYKGSNGIDYAMPTLLGDNYEQSKNFAELLFAICFPEEWENNVLNTDVSMFHDFDKDNIRYHRQYFWERVQKAWTDSKTLMNIMFGADGSLQDFQTMLKSKDGLNLLTNGYSWITKGFGATNSPTLYRYRFTNGEGKESNMHKEPIKGGILHNYHSVKNEVIRANIKLNCIKDYTLEHPGWFVPAFFGTNNKHYIIRHSTGAKLSSDGKEKPKEPLKGVSEVYRYNKYYGISDLNQDPEVLKSSYYADDKEQQDISDYSGYSYYRVGDVFKDQKGSTWFVVNEAGHIFDNSPYSELISFEGIETDGKGSATNIPTRDKADRGAMLLWALYKTYVEGMSTDTFTEEIVNLRDAKIGIKNLFAPLLATASDEEATVHVGAYAYRGSTAGEQPLVRFVMNNKDSNQPFQFYLWDKYPKTPDKTTLFVKDFSDQSILLQHVSSFDYVKMYAEDAYAHMRLYDIYGGSEERSPRLTADASAKNVENYFYDYEEWELKHYSLDMWNAPVLVFRMTAVYDRGVEKHAAKTVDGDELTLVKKAYDLNDHEVQSKKSLKYYQMHQLLNQAQKSRYLNGQKQAYKKWNEVWK